MSNVIITNRVNILLFMMFMIAIFADPGAAIDLAQRDPGGDFDIIRPLITSDNAAEIVTLDTIQRASYKRHAWSTEGYVFLEQQSSRGIVFYNLLHDIVPQKIDEAFLDVTAIALSPDRRTAAVVNNKNVLLVDLLGDSELITLDIATLNYTIWDVEFSPDGLTLVVLTGDGGVHLWDMETYEFKAFFVTDITIPFHTTYSPNGETLAVSGDGGSIELWNIYQSRQIVLPERHTNVIRTTAFSPDGRWLASGDADGQILLWDLETQETVATFSGHDDWVNDLTFSSDGRLIVSASSDKTVRIWDFETRQLLTTLEGHERAVHSVKFWPEGTVIASASEDKTLRLWGIE